MPAPTFMAEYESAFTSGSSKSVTVTTNAGDVLVVVAISADNGTLNTPTGNSLTYTLQQSVQVSSYAQVRMYTATDATGGAGWSLAMTRTGTIPWGINCLRFSGSAGIGASSKTNVASGAPTLNITTTAANSAIVVGNGDFNCLDGTSRVWRTNAGTVADRTYFLDPAEYGAYIGNHTDSGAIATYAVGLSAPAGQKYAIVAVEVKGSIATSTAPPMRLFNPVLLQM